MTKEQLAEGYALSKFPRAYEYDGRRTWESLCPLDRFEDAENAYKAGYEAAEPKWIKCSDKMPENLDDVLVFGAGEIMQAYFHKGKWKGSTNITDAMDDANVYDATISDTNTTFNWVTHWMPLPKTPQL